MKLVSVLPSRISLIYAMDLEPIVFKLINNEHGESPSLEEVDDAVVKYRQFLELCMRYPNQGIVPTNEIDMVWHAHILDTVKYREDCQVVFGQFIDHFPYLGMRSEEDEINLINSFKETDRLFKKHFGKGLIDSATRCGNACGNAKCKYIVSNRGMKELRPRLNRLAA